MSISHVWCCVLGWTASSLRPAQMHSPLQVVGILGFPGLYEVPGQSTAMGSVSALSIERLRTVTHAIPARIAFRNAMKLPGQE